MTLPHSIFTIQRIFIFTLAMFLIGIISCKDEEEQPAPQATSISPNTGLPGSVAIISGMHFSSEKG